MVQELITVRSGKINDYIHHIDLHEFGMRRILSSYIGEFDNTSVVLDSGSSIEVKRIWRYANKNKIPLSSFKYLIPTHHHFDHAGGMWKLHEKIKEYNPEVKILTNTLTKDLLNDSEYHIGRARRTYDDFVGEMRPINEKAFKIIEPTENFTEDLNSFDIVDTFTDKGSEVKLAVIKTPGHTYDHQCSVFIKDGEIDFIHLGEAIGTIYHSTELLSMPTSMPVYFNYKNYMETLDKLKKLDPIKVGFGHFGVINGKENVHKFVEEHESSMKEFRSLVIKYYKEKPETKHVFKKLIPYFIKKTDISGEDGLALQNIILGVVYGMMMDLKYRDD